MQLHGANLRLRLVQSQHSQEVRQLREQVEQRVPLGRVAELQQLLEREWCAAQQLRKECGLQEEKGRQLEAQRVSGDKCPKAS